MGGHRLIIFGVLATLFLGGLAYGLVAVDRPSQSARVTIAQRDDGLLSVRYRFAQPQHALLLSTLPENYRARLWSVATEGFSISQKGIIRPDDNRQFNEIEIHARPDENRLNKDYQPFAPYGDQGQLIYTGHFWPKLANGQRMKTLFDVLPANNGAVVGLGRAAPELRSWQSPNAHPAFLYLGPQKPIKTSEFIAVIDPNTPQWIVDEFNHIASVGFETLAAMFEAEPIQKPDLFISVKLDSNDGQLSYAGDALPGQIQITLEGGGWQNPTDKGREIFAHSTLHEAVHLWQTSARPLNDKVPGWIHEGAADAITAEVLVAAGWWDGDAFAQDEARAQRECTARLYYGPVASAAKRGDYRALYACGQVIAQAISRAEGTSTAAFWKAFVAKSGDNAGYDEDLFYALVAERTGDVDFTNTIRRFVRTPYANPEKAIGDLFAAASAVNG
ncbi:hypothetical protein [Hyphococcus sp. DH-69]|uniref:hypothetical protein n=1 Tax=Hyphococcus formosus TaxID=3143534 RepID=UPI00398AC281